MRKVLIFALTIAIALGGLGYAHAAVTEQQDELLVYPVVESGDRAVLEGMTASMTFACGDHLRWYTDYTFGGETETEFSYSFESFVEPAGEERANLDIWFTGGMSTSTNASIALNGTGYGRLFQAVAAATPDGESKTMNLKMADHVDYYLPDYELDYNDGERYCSHGANLYSMISGNNWYEDEGNYDEFMSLFRFPVQESHIVSVTVDKNYAGAVNGLSMYPENGPELHFRSDVTAEGLWFVPVFQDEQGDPLPYESPEGHGIYHIPWKSDGTVNRNGGEMESLIPDLDRVRLLVPLEDNLVISHMEIDGEKGEAWMLTLEENVYVLTAYDLTTGETTVRIEVLPYESGDFAPDGAFVRDEGYLLVTAQGNVALVEENTGELVLTAPDAAEQEYSAVRYSAADGDLRFDGEHLILIDTTFNHENAFWAAIYRQGELVYYGEYDCSIMRGNDDWYYSYITVEEEPIGLK